MSKLESLAVFCGSSKGRNPIHENCAIELGKLLAEKNIQIVYGAGNVGLMGIIANSCLENNGKIVGVIPSFLKEWEVCHNGLTELIVTQTMHERKAIMADRSDGFIILPGGFGTLDEFFEILTWKQLHLHEKPIGILNVNGYFDKLKSLVEHMVEEGFVKPVNLELLTYSDDLEDLIIKMKEMKTKSVPKWFSLEDDKR